MKELRRRICLYVIPCIFVLTSCSSDPSKGSGNTDLYTHTGSNIPFPYEQSGFTRQSITEESPEDTGVTVQYLFSQGGEDVPMDVMIYPHPDPIDPEEFKKNPRPNQEAQMVRMLEVKEEILKSGTDKEHRFVAYYDVIIVRNEKPFFAKRLFFRDRDNVFVNVYIVEYGKWIVEYRTVFTRDLERPPDDFLFDHKWNVPSDPDES